MELVNREEILKRLPDDLPYKSSVKRVLIQAPTVDAVEVVRCKDCKHYNGIWCIVDDDIDMWKTVELDGFCSSGERREGD